MAKNLRDSVETALRMMEERLAEKDARIKELLQTLAKADEKYAYLERDTVERVNQLLEQIKELEVQQYAAYDEGFEEGVASTYE